MLKVTVSKNGKLFSLLEKWEMSAKIPELCIEEDFSS